MAINLRKIEKRNLLAVSVIALSLLTMVFICILWNRYPTVEISRAELYGEDGGNLKDFEINGEGIISLSSDPWIEYSLQQQIRVNAIEIDMQEIEENLTGEIFDMNTWESVTFPLKNGRVIVFFPNASTVERECFRFDLVSSSNAYLQIDKIVINSKYGLLLYAIPRFVCIWIFFLLYIHFISSAVSNTRIRCKLPQKISFTLTSIVYLVLFGVFLYNMEYGHLSVPLMLIMFLTLIIEVILILIRMDKRRQDYAGVRFLELLLFASLNTGIIELLSGMEFSFTRVWSGIWNVLLALFVLFVFYFIVRNMKASMILLNVFSVVLGIVNHYFYIFRGVPFGLSDILMADTALTVLKNYTYEVDKSILYLILLEAGVIGYLLLHRNKKENNKIVQAACVVSVMVAGGMLVYMPIVSYWDKVGFVREYGYLNSFVLYAKKDMDNNKPERYSADAVEEILALYDEENSKTEKMPNIVVIMNESFADLPSVYNFETNVDGMPFIHSLHENTIKGSMLVSAYGGSTVNTEYEFLTGNTLAFLNYGSVPYMQHVKRTQQSLVHQLRNGGYETIAFHPYLAGNYNRNKVYEWMGFEKFISLEDGLKYDTLLRWVVSDEANYLNVIDFYENRTEGKPFFLFNVTMQNHGGYHGESLGTECEVMPVDEELHYPQLIEYLTLIRESDRAFKNLLQYFEGVDEDVIVLMFGDHQPGLASEIYDKLDYREHESPKEQEKLFTVPFVLWANYDIEEEENVWTSANFLRSRLLENSGIPLGNYDRFLQSFEQEYPAINAAGYIDAFGDYNYSYNLPEEGVAQMYRILQYGNIFDKTIDLEQYME